MSTKEQHLFVDCPTCYGGLIPLDEKARVCVRKGLGPGTTGDWVECADCQGTKRVEIVERLLSPTSHSVVVDGRRSDAIA